MHCCAMPCGADGFDRPMPTLDWLDRDAAFSTAAQVPTRVLRPHAQHAQGVGDTTAGNLLIQGDNLAALAALLPCYRAR